MNPKNKIKSLKLPSLIVLLISFSFVISSCDLINNGNDPRNAQYFQGTEGVRMQFTDNTPPSRVYFYGDQNSNVNLGNIDTNNVVPQQYADNVFDVNVELKNVGANYAFGTVYFTGYNPNMIFIPPYDPQLYAGHFNNRPFSACSPSINNAYNDGKTWTIFLDCNLYGGNIVFSGGYNDKLNSFGNVDVNMGWLLDKAGITNWFENSSLYMGSTFFRPGEDQPYQYNFMLDWAKFNFEDGYYGKLAFAKYLDYYKRVHGTGSFPDDPTGFPFYLEGNNYYFPGGAGDFITASPSYIKAFPVGLDETDQAIVATACYIYTTHATPSVCIDRYPYDGSRKVCTPQEINWKNSQGAPVAITSVRQENTPRKILFEIDIQNVGNGEVYSPYSMHKCNPWNPARTLESDKNVVELLWISLGPTGYENIRCTPTTRAIRLDQNGKGTITCEYDIPADTPSTAYKDNLVIELAYGYSQTMQKNMNIKRVS